MTSKEFTKTGEDYAKLSKISKQLLKQDENACNYGLSSRQEKMVERLKAEANQIAGKYGLQAYHQGDPRGASLYVMPKRIAKSKLYAVYYEVGEAII